MTDDVEELQDRDVLLRLGKWWAYSTPVFENWTETCRVAKQLEEKYLQETGLHLSIPATLNQKDLVEKLIEIMIKTAKAHKKYVDVYYEWAASPNYRLLFGLDDKK